MAKVLLLRKSIITVVFILYIIMYFIFPSETAKRKKKRKKKDLYTYIHIQGVSKLMVHTLGGDRTHQDE